MSRFTKYITVEGDRWDNIAYRAYGNPNEVEALIFANPSVPVTDVLPPGLELLVPIKDDPEVQQSNLPPWKR